MSIDQTFYWLSTLIMVPSEPLDDSPPLPLSVPSASGLFSLSSSGSLQTHLSSFNSEQRLRGLPSVAGDLENQADPDSDDPEDGAHNGVKKRIAVKQRVWWFMRVFIWFSTLFFPISLLGDYGFLSPYPLTNAFSVDYESGLLSFSKSDASTDVLPRILTLSLGKRTTLVQNYHPQPSALTIPLLYLRRLLQLPRSYCLCLV